MKSSLARGFVIVLIILPVSAFEGQQITFQFQAPKETRSVHLAGDFNNWSTTATPLTDPEEDGIWTTTLTLEYGEYQYRFVVNGKRWFRDPENLLYGGENSNSILILKDPRWPELRDLRPRTGTVIRDNTFTISARYIDGIERRGIDRDSIVVKVDGILRKAQYDEDKELIICKLTDLSEGDHTVEVQAQDNQGFKARPLSSLIIVNADNQPPIAEAGYTQMAGVQEPVTLNGGLCYDPDHDPLVRFRWRILSKPLKSRIALKHSNSPFPQFIPDQEGRYVFGLTVTDGQLQSREDSVDVIAFTRHHYPTLFEISQKDFAQPFQSVHLAGEFNHWSPTDMPLYDYDNNGVWATFVDLEPGEYEYKFVINGKDWVADPTNPDKVADGWGDYNSVKSVSFTLAPIPKVQFSLSPRGVTFDATESLSRVGTGLQIHWYQDINNPQRVPLEHKARIQFPLPRAQGTYVYYLVVTDQFGSSQKKVIGLKIATGTVQISDFSDSPDWGRDAIIYEIFVRQFTPEGTLQALQRKLPYLKNLGVNCLWLMPVFQSPTTHGYAPSDYFTVDTEYGTNADLKELIEAAHQAGFRIILDFMANHSSDQHPYFLSAYQNPKSVYRHWYRWRQAGSQMTYEYYNDWDQFPDLNYDNPQVRQYILSAAQYWLDLGIDGYRCDVAWGIPHDFWKSFRRALKTINGELLLLNEVLPRSPLYHQDEFDMSYDTDFYGNLLDVMRGRKPVSAIRYGLNKTRKNYPPGTLDLRYMENHDVERFFTQFGKAKTKLAAALLFTIPGAPLIYYGQEIGLQEPRPQMDWAHGDAELFKYYKKLIQLRNDHPAFRRGEMIRIPSEQEEWVYAYIRKYQREAFLVILNFADTPLSCRLNYPDSLFPDVTSGKVQLVELLEKEPKEVETSELLFLELELKATSAYIFQIVMM